MRKSARIIGPGQVRAAARKQAVKDRIAGRKKVDAGSSRPIPSATTGPVFA